jgi:hypothetical protein
MAASVEVAEVSDVLAEVVLAEVAALVAGLLAALVIAELFEPPPPQAVSINTTAINITERPKTRDFLIMSSISNIIDANLNQVVNTVYDALNRISLKPITPSIAQTLCVFYDNLTKTKEFRNIDVIFGPSH